MNLGWRWNRTHHVDGGQSPKPGSRVPTSWKEGTTAESRASELWLDCGRVWAGQESHWHCGWRPHGQPGCLEERGCLRCGCGRRWPRAHTGREEQFSPGAGMEPARHTPSSEMHPGHRPFSAPQSGNQCSAGCSHPAAVTPCLTCLSEPRGQSRGLAGPLSVPHRSQGPSIS